MSALHDTTWVNVNGSPSWGTTFTPATTTPAKASPTKGQAVQWTSTWETQPSVMQKKTLQKEKKSEQTVDTQNMIKAFQSITFINKESNAAAAWQPQVNTTQTDPTVKKKKKQEEKEIIEGELAKQNLYKTELCRSWIETGLCRYGHKCQFAHGEHELRPVLRHPKYKTEICKTFSTTGSCPYGPRCRFIHTASSSETTPVQDIKPVTISVPMHTPVVITVGNVPAIITPAPAHSQAKIVTPQSQSDSDSDGENVRKSRLSFFQNLTTEDV